MVKRYALTVGFLAVAGFSSGSAWARGYGSSTGGDELPNLLTVGAGIASPSVSSALGENPAGLTLNTRTKIVADVTSAGGGSDLGVGGTFLAGNGFVGGGLGLHTSTGGATQNPLVLTAGLGAEITSMRMSLGVDAAHDIVNGGSGPYGIDIGMLFNKYGDVKVGLTAFGVLGGIDAVGVGVGYDASSQATLVLDGTWDPMGTGDGVSLKPGLKIHLSQLQLALGYGFDLSNGGASHLDKGISIGAGFSLGDHINLQAYYNQLSKYYAGLMFRI